MATATGFRRVARDVTDLFELQMQLLALDGRLAASQALTAAITLGFAMAILLASTTLMLLAGAWAIHEYFDFRLSASLLMSGTLGLLIVAILSAISFKFARQASAALGETREELRANIRWTVSMLIGDASSTSVTDPASKPVDHSPRPFNGTNGNTKTSRSRF